MELDQLPQNAKRAPKSAIYSWMLDLIILPGMILVAPLTVLLFIQESIWAIVAVVGILVLWGALVFAVPRIWHRYYFFAIADDQLVVQRGAFKIKRTVVPFARVQNVDTQHGPIDRKLGLINLVVHTAAHPVKIQCVATEDGMRIRDELVSRVKRVRDELTA